MKGSRDKLSETQKAILRILFVGPSSQKDLAEKLGVSKAATSMAISPLAQRGMVSPSGKEEKGLGRPEVLLSLNGSYGRFLGLDLKGTSVHLDEMDFAGKLLSTARYSNLDEALLALQEKKGSTCLGIGATVRHFHDLSSFQAKHPEEAASLKAAGACIENNVDALADIYHELSHNENFLLVKYGPGLGSSAYINGAPVMRNRGHRSELGHSLYHGKTLEEQISFASLFGEELEENEGVEELKKDKEKEDFVLSLLAEALVNADVLLSLDTVVFSGVYFSQQENISALKQKILALYPEFNATLFAYPDYAYWNRAKGPFLAFLSAFGD